MLMVKPGMAYLDIVRDVKNKVYIGMCVRSDSDMYSFTNATMTIDI